MTAVLVVLIAAVAFISWACVRVYRQTGWHDDEVESAAFIAALRADGNHLEALELTARLRAANAKARRDMAANQ